LSTFRICKDEQPNFVFTSESAKPVAYAYETLATAALRSPK